jgi:Cdc6-like AAA superfamily ATPase
MVALYYFCLDHERLRISMVRDVCPEAVVEYRTDSVLFRDTSLKKVFRKWTFKDLGGRGEENPFHLEETCPTTPPVAFDPNTTCPTPETKFEWNLMVEDDAYEQASKIIDAGQSLYISGRAGTGKTFLVRRLMERLRATGQRVVPISLTHVAAKLLGGVTVQCALHRYVLNGSMENGWIVCDEVSFLGISIKFLDHSIIK